MSIVPTTETSSDWQGGMTFIEQLAKRLVIKKLMKINQGQLNIVFQDEHYQSKPNSTAADLKATIHVKHPQFFVDIAFGGEPGAGESYMQNYWTTDNLTHLVQLMVRNRQVLINMNSRLAALQKMVMKLAHRLNANSRKGSQKNIGAHYDIGNNLFELFLDPTMMYSSGIFQNADMSMEDASNFKLDTICKRLRLKETDQVIEIGTGWGSFAIYAAKHYGCHVTTTTISKEQYKYTEAQVKHHGLEDKITLLNSDYRDLDGKFDKLVSIEMIEAVGHKYMNTYISKCASLLKDSGSMLIQAITIQDQYYDRYIKSTDFIKRYIFPGGCLPSVSSINNTIKKYSDLNAFHIESFGDSYARTLEEWRLAFFNQLSKVRELGYNNDFIRMWEYYLCYCEGGFKERSIDVKHLIFTKPMSRLTPIIVQ